jgi:hypothetical protein
LLYDDHTALNGVTYWYKVSATNDNGEGALSAEDSGYWENVLALDCVKTNPRILILNDEIDLVAENKVDKIIKLSDKKSFKKDKLVINQITQKVKNFDNFFSVNNNESVFKNINWRFQPYKVYEDSGELLFDGIIRDVVRDHGNKLANIIVVDELFKYQKEKIEYESSDWETPSAAAKNIMDAIGFTNYNEASFTTSTNQYETNNCYIKVNFNKSANVTLQSALDKLGAIGCADVYSHRNNVYFQHWQPFTGGVSIFLTQSNIRNKVVVSQMDSEIINQYRIGYRNDGDTPVTDSNVTTSIGTLSQTKFGIREMGEIRGREGTDIIFKDAVSAQYIGECYIKRTNKNHDTDPEPLIKIQLELPFTFEDWIDLQTYFALTLSDEDWVEKKFEIFETEIDYTVNNIKIVAYEVIE